MPKNNRTVNIVGAGLVGSVLAAYLAKRGAKIVLWERRPDLRKENISGGRSINLAVSTRGLHALHQLGLEKNIYQDAVPMRGRMIHSVIGELNFQPYGRNESQCIYSFSRAHLNRILLDCAQRSGDVEIRFNRRLV